MQYNNSLELAYGVLVNETKLELAQSTSPQFQGLEQVVRSLIKAELLKPVEGGATAKFSPTTILALNSDYSK